MWPQGAVFGLEGFRFLKEAHSYLRMSQLAIRICKCCPPSKHTKCISASISESYSDPRTFYSLFNHAHRQTNMTQIVRTSGCFIQIPNRYEPLELVLS
jgi:hypothetical protein